MDIDINISEFFPSNIAFEQNVVPLALENDTMTLGLENPNDKKLIEEIVFNTGYKIVPVKMSPEIISSKLQAIYGESENKRNGDVYVEDLNQESSTVEFVTQMINNAIRLNASDIHIEPTEEYLRIRYRIDSRLIEISNLPLKKGLLITSRIKIMANLDISEKRRPQDGKISFMNEASKNIDLRVSTLPTNYGEKVVLRILDKSNLNLDLQSLGLNDDQLNILLKKIYLPHGMILFTGPTGSGKTTTLYSILKKIHTPEKNILTIEDPVEYNIHGINQCHVKPEIGFTFANALRSFLRQDPDIIMVGEIRDSETAEIAIKASLTGHLVFSTLHTNDSVSAITRLIDMGIEPYLVAASIKLIVSQRLVRKLCACKIPGEDLVLENSLDKTKAFKKNGCPDCYHTGYKGRTAIYEFFNINDEMEELIALKTSTQSLKNKARNNGLITLQEAGFEKIKSGITSYEEVLYETTL
jgi:type IV pilus assembly protein PilB